MVFHNCFLQIIVWSTVLVHHGEVGVYSWSPGIVVPNVNESQIVESNLKVYPSPSFNYLNLDGPKEDYCLQIFNIQGKLFHEMKNINGNQKIDVSSLPIGLYILKLNYNKSFKTMRFVKQ